MKVTAHRVRQRREKGQAKPVQAREAAPAPETPGQGRVPPLTVTEERGNVTVRLDGSPVGSVSSGGADRRIRWVWRTYRAGHADTVEQGIAATIGAAWSLVEFVDRQAEVETGPDQARVRKLLKEIEKAPDTLDLWLDLMLVAIDGFARNGGEGRALIEGLDARQAQLLTALQKAAE